jgi:hypothetical protein
MAMLDWNAYRQHLTVRIGQIAKLSPDTIKGYRSLTAAGHKTDLLGPKIRELISLAVVRRDGCITVHTEGRVTARRGKRSLKHLASRPPSMPVPPSSIPPACWTPTTR